MEHPDGFEPPVSELQSLALPLGYGCSVEIIALSFSQNNKTITLFVRKIWLIVFP